MMTMREVDISLKNIHSRKNNKHCFEASLHGYKLNSSNENQEVEDYALTDAEEKASVQALQDAMNRKQKELKHG